MMDVTPLTIIAVLIATWTVAMVLVWAAVIPWLSRRPANDAVTGLLWHVVRVYVRLVHRVRYEGVELLQHPVDERGLIVVSNHTGAVDPLLIQAGCPFHIRWMMASEMMGPGLDWLWRHQRLIAVERDGTDTGPLREAIRHVKTGNVLGIFPEGRIVTPPRRVWPFIPGIGLIVARTGAPVLLTWVSGTPDTNRMTASLTTPSRARVVFVERLEFADTRDANVIANRLRHKLAEVSGWPLVDEVPPRSVPDLDPFSA